MHILLLKARVRGHDRRLGSGRVVHVMPYSRQDRARDMRQGDLFLRPAPPPRILIRAPQPVSPAMPGGLSEGEAKSVRQYTGFLFGPINGKLRRGESLTGNEAKVAEELDRLTRRAVVSSSQTVSRSIRIENAQHPIFHANVGAVFTDPAYASTTKGREPLEQYTGGADHVQLRIHLREGQRGPIDVGALTDTPQEREMILPRDSRYRITGRSKLPSGALQLDLEYLGSARLS